MTALQGKYDRLDQNTLQAAQGQLERKKPSHQSLDAFSSDFERLISLFVRAKAPKSNFEQVLLFTNALASSPYAAAIADYKRLHPSIEKQRLPRLLTYLREQEPNIAASIAANAASIAANAATAPPANTARTAGGTAPAEQPQFHYCAHHGFNRSHSSALCQALQGPQHAAQRKVTQPERGAAVIYGRRA